MKTRARRGAGRVRGRGGGPALAGRAGRAAHAARCSRSDERYLALEWVEPGRLSAGGRGGAGARPGGARTLRGRRRSARRAARRADTGFGSLRLPNEPDARLADVLRQRRLLPLARIARERGALSRRRRARRRSACASGSRELCGPPEPPARLHGDLWGGQRDGRRRRARLADRPVRLRRAPRGRPGDAAPVRRAVAAASSTPTRRRRRWPTAAPERVELYQLLPLLVHAILFGGSYGAGRRARRATLRVSSPGGARARAPAGAVAVRAATSGSARGLEPRQAQAHQRAAARGAARR